MAKKKCINCGKTLEIGQLIRYKCSYCKTEYEYVECIDYKKRTLYTGFIGLYNKIKKILRQ